MTRSSGRFDLAVVGAGIIGLATALAAVRRSLRVVVVDRDAQANGASVRNFGFITVTGQERGSMWSRARRTREVWLEVAAAGIGGGARGFHGHRDGRRVQGSDSRGGPAPVPATQSTGACRGTRKHH